MPDPQTIAAVGLITVGPLYCIYCGLRHYLKQYSVGKGKNKKTYIICEKTGISQRRW